MKLYYCFNGVFDFEYYVNDLDVAYELSKIVDLVIEIEAVKKYANIYTEYLESRFKDDAYWEYLAETKADFLDDKRLNRHQRELNEEDRILGVKR